MRLHQLSCLALSALTLGLTSACAGGQTGDLSGENGNETGNVAGGCDEHQEPLDDFDEATDAGSANQLLEYAERTFDAPITWKSAADGQSWTVGPESGEGVLHLSVARGTRAYRLTYSAHQDDSGAGEELAVAAVCPPPQLGVEARVTVTTDGGALAESFDTLLRSETQGVATLDAPLNLQDLAGDLSVSFSESNAKLVQSRIQAVLMSEGTTGAISGMEQVGSGSGPNGVSSASRAVLAVWPDSAACQRASAQGDGLGVSLADDVLGVSGADTLTSAAPSGPTAITWMDGERTTLEFGIESEGEGCFRVRQSPVPGEGGPAVEYPVTITLKSADGRVDGRYPGTVLASGTGGARQVIASALLNLASADAAASGFASVEVPSGTETLSVRIESKQVGGIASGLVRLVAWSASPCSAQAPVPGPSGSGMGSPGCAGATQTPLESASWGD